MRWRNLTLLRSRIWQNYLMPSRLGELADWFRLSLARGYKFYSIAHYWRLTEAGRKAPPPKSIVLRHDIDVDLAAASAMYSLEKELSIASSYYFRLGTLDLPLMRAIADAGGEASYHYEELATEVKARCLRSVAQIHARLPMMRQRFRENLQRVRAMTGLPMTTVAAHGDWANRALGLPNTELLKCPELRAGLDVQVEAYDPELMKFVTARYADAACPTWWVGKRIAPSGQGRLEFFDNAPGTPADAVRAGLPVIYVLLHPEQWRRGPRWHFREQVNRVKEALAYRLGVPVGSTRMAGPEAGSLEERLGPKPGQSASPSPTIS
jgi:hypothetical protein